MIWQCPNCSASFAETESGWRCTNGHSFDKAKQGYINLLLANQKNSRDPGDNREMVLGRRTFLQQGHYRPLVEAIAALLASPVEREASAAQPPALLDLGCGEGYYLSALGDLLPALAQADVNGVDISREAVKRAAVSLPGAQFCVASSYRLPVTDACIDIVLQVFAPTAEAELQRVLTSSGLWLRVSPGPRHLYQLKAALYERVTEHEVPSVPPGFQLIEQKPVSFRVTLTGEQAIGGLLAMTPFGWHGSREGQQALLELSSFTTDADFIVQLMRRDATTGDSHHDR